MVLSNGINQQTYVKIFSEQNNPHVIMTSHKITNIKCEGNSNESNSVQIPEIILVSSRRLSNPITSLDRPRGFQEDEAPRFQDSQHMKVVRLSALRTGQLYPPQNIPGTHFC